MTKRIQKNIDDWAKFIGVPDWESLYENNADYFWELERETRVYLLTEGYTEEEAEQRAEQAQAQAEAELYTKWKQAVLATANDLFSFHGMELVPTTQDKDPYVYRVVPDKKVGWKGVVTKLRETINGYGPFYFHTDRELLQSGPYTPFQCVVNHLGYVPDYPVVFGADSPKSMYYRHMR